MVPKATNLRRNGINLGADLGFCKILLRFPSNLNKFVSSVNKEENQPVRKIKLYLVKHSSRKFYRTMHCLRRRGYFAADTNAEELRYRRTSSFLSENAATDQFVSERSLSSSVDSISVRDFIRTPVDNQWVLYYPVLLFFPQAFIYFFHSDKNQSVRNTNRSVYQGPITVEWEQQNENEIENDDQERNKAPRLSSELIISPETRLGMLKQNGCSLICIQESLNATNTERIAETASLKIKKHQDDKIVVRTMNIC